MAAEVLSFQQEEGKTAYYATFVSDGNPVTIQIKNKGGMVTVFANMEGIYYYWMALRYCWLTKSRYYLQITKNKMIKNKKI